MSLSLRSRKISRLSVGALAILATLLAAACGSSSSSGTQGGTSSTLPIVNIGIANAVVDNLVPFYASDQGIFKQYGVNAKVSILSSTTTVAALAAGKIQFAVVGSPQVETANLQGLPIKWAASWSNDLGLVIVANKNISSLADLRGKSVAVTSTGGTLAMVVQAALQQHGIPASSVKMVPTGTSSGQVSAFSSGAVSAFICDLAVAQQVYTKVPGSHSVYTVTASNLPWVNGGLAIDEQYASTHKTVVAKTIAAIMAAMKSWVNPANKAKVDATIARLTNVSRARAAQSYAIEAPTFSTNFEVTNAVESNVLKVLAETGTNSKASDAAAANFIDDSYLTQAGRIHA